MPVNMDKPDRWKSDVALSVDTYNKWFMRFAPGTYRNARVVATKQVESALRSTSNLQDISPRLLKQDPSILPILRMATAPPIARDRLVGLAQVSPHLVTTMEKESKLPRDVGGVDDALTRIGDLIYKLADKDIFTWLQTGKTPDKSEVLRASTIVADRLCGAASDPIIRNSQEQRQLELISGWLEKRGYQKSKTGQGLKFNQMKPGTYAIRLNVPVSLNEEKRVNIPVDVVIKPKASKENELPILVEAKSAGDFTNTNKRRKEEATKIAQLKKNYGARVRYVLFLCGYFDTGYLGYEAAEGIDWIWEHRIDDLSMLGV
jgi:hypothetical protein